MGKIKEIKKLRQLYRKDIRDQYALIKDVIKPKPWWVPKFMWQALWRFLIRDLTFPKS